MIRAFAKLTAQEIFDKVATHLLTQNQKSKFGKDCLYFSNELRCAAGCLIEEEEYCSEIENQSWGRLVELEWVSNHCQDLIKELQGVHDNYYVDSWENRLKEVAEKHGLKWGSYD